MKTTHTIPNWSTTPYGWAYNPLRHRETARSPRPKPGWRRAVRLSSPAWQRKSIVKPPPPQPVPEWVQGINRWLETAAHRLGVILGQRDE